VKETHEKKFTGWWIPAYVVELLQDKTISKSELLLLGAIHGFTDKGKGCYASNEYLGKLIGVSASRIGYLVNHLKELGLVKQTKFDGRHRWIITRWDVPPKEISDQNNEADSVKTMTLPPRKQRGRVSENNDLLTKGINQGDIPRVRKRTLGRPAAATAVGFNLDEWTSRIGKKLVSVLRKYESDLIFPSGKRRPVTSQKMAEVVSKVCKVRKVPRKEVDRVVAWLKDHYGDEFTPKMHRADDLADNWRRYVEAMSRSANGDGEGQAMISMDDFYAEEELQ